MLSSPPAFIAAESDDDEEATPETIAAALQLNVEATEEVDDPVDNGDWAVDDDLVIVILDSLLIPSLLHSRHSSFILLCLSRR